MKNLLATIFTCLITVLFVSAQYNTPQNYQWRFGDRAGLDFSSGSPVAVRSAIYQLEGSASVADAFGNLLFYTDGRYVWDRTDNLMPTAGGAIVTYPTFSCTMPATIARVPGSTSLYYVFSLEDNTGGLRDGGRSHLSYSIIDMSLRSGLGDITATRGVAIEDTLSEKMIIVPGNNCDLWLVTHHNDSPLFFCYNINSGGLSSTPVISRAGTVGCYYCYTLGGLKATHNRQKLALLMRPAFGSSAGNGSAQLYDFNPSTGVVSNCIPFDTLAYSYGTEFSPNDTLLYVNYYGGIFQYDITSGIASSIKSTANNIGAAYSETDLKLAVDNKIYFRALRGSSLGCIANPNVRGSGCGYTASAVTMVSGTSPQLGFSNTFFEVIPPDTLFSRTDTTACIPTSGFPLSAPASRTSVYWNTGDTTRSIIVDSAGTYWCTSESSCQIYIDSFIIYRSVPAGPSVTTPIKYCRNDVAAPLSATGTGLTWYSVPPPATGSTTTPTPATDATGAFSWYVTQTVSGCESAPSEIKVAVIEKPTIDFDYNISYGCDRDTVIFTNLSAFGSGYVWTFDNTLSLLTNEITFPRYYPSLNTAKAYTIKLVGNNDVCFDSVTKTMVVNAFVSTFKLANVTPDQSIPVGSSIQLNASGATIYYWRPNDGTLNDPNINNPIARPVDSTTYTVYGYSIDGCLDSAFVHINVIKNDTSVVPTAFTPNGDGKNDVFRLINTGFARLLEFSVFNRWGEVVFQTNDITMGWDGSHNGTAQDIGVYNYVIIGAGSDGSSKMYKGTVTLIR